MEAIKTLEEREKELIELGTKQGYITYEQLAEKLKGLDIDADSLDELYNMLIENGIDLTTNIDGYCTFTNARRILGRTNHLTLQDIASECGYYLHNAHNAYSDVWATVAVYTYIKKIEEQQKGE